MKATLSYFLWLIYLSASVHKCNGRMKFVVNMPDVSPKEKEAYLCTSKKLLAVNSYAIEFNPLADEETAHHMLVYACAKPYVSDRNYWDCHSSPVCGHGEEKIIYAWAKNAPKLELPYNTGFKLGPAVDLSHIVVQVHYARPLDDDEVDGSGVEISLTRAPQKFIAGIYLFESSQFAIPPKSIGYHVDISCKYYGMTMMPFAFRTHTHDRGRSISAYRIRNGVWSLIGIGSPQRAQAFYPTKKDNRNIIKDGDILAARCTFDSPNASTTIYPGSYSTDEMCNFYMMVFAVNKELHTIPEGCHVKSTALNFPAGSSLPEPDMPINTLPTISPKTTTTTSTTTTSTTTTSTTREKVAPISKIVTYHIPSASKHPQANSRLQKISYPIVDSKWHIPEKTFGEICGIAMYRNNDLVVLLRGDRVWNQDTFDDENYYTGKQEAISSHTILHLDKVSGKIKQMFGENLFYMPHGVTIDLVGNYWITDIALHQVFKLIPDKLDKPSLTIGVASSPGNDNNHFCKPTHVAIDDEGNVFVSDGYCNNRIMKFSPTGEFLTKWGMSDQETNPGPAQFKLPSNLVLDYSKKLLYVCDRNNARIQVFTTDGTFLRVIQHKAFGKFLFSVALNHVLGDILYAVGGNYLDAQGYTIRSSTGEILNTWNANGHGFKRPHSLAVSHRGNFMFVSDLNENTVWKFRINMDEGFPWKEIENAHSTMIPDTTDEDQHLFDTLSNDTKDVNMIPAIVVVVVLATPIVLVFIAAVIQHMRFNHKKKKVLKKLRKRGLNNKHAELCYGCCLTPRYYYDSRRGFGNLIREHNESSSDDDEGDLFSRKA